MLFKEKISCLVCGSNEFSIKFRFEYESNSVLDKINIIEKFDPKIEFRVCNKCSHCFTSPQLSENALTKYYENSSVHYDNLIPKDNTLVNYKNDQIINYIYKYVKEGNFLDIGCGRGELLSRLDSKYWKLFGVEPSSYASNMASSNLKDATIINGFLNGNTLNQKFDVITVMDVFEHVANINLLMEQILPLLNDDGILVIKTGDTESTSASIAKGHWSYFGSWEHLSFFNRNSMYYLLNKHGFKNIDFYQFSNTKTISKAYINELVKSLFGIFIYNFKFKFLLKLINREKVYFGFGKDHFITIARKTKLNS
jgi:2-polyprenyl-3-methyl-5-hydroxy-6-metoxy-1,4-benzoquinol methylase